MPATAPAANIYRMYCMLGATIPQRPPARGLAQQARRTRATAAHPKCWRRSLAALWLVGLALPPAAAAAPPAATPPAATPSPAAPETTRPQTTRLPANIKTLAAQTSREAAALAAAVEPWTLALERAKAALAAAPEPNLTVAEAALADARAARDAATPKLTTATEAFQALQRAANGRRVFPPVVLTAASAFRGAAGAYHDRTTRQGRLEEALTRARTPPDTPAPDAPPAQPRGGGAGER